jgi:hypothetical protein
MEQERYNKILLKLTAAGWINGYKVTPHAGFITYILPRWVHSLSLRLMCSASNKYNSDVITVLIDVYEPKEGE